MRNHLRISLAVTAALFVAACATDMATSPLASSDAAIALVSAPISFDQINTSFVGVSNETGGFMPDGEGWAGDHHHGDGGRGPGWGEFMGGGLGEAWIGGIGFGRGIGRGPFGDIDDDDNCAFSSTTSRVECPANTHGGLTITRSYSLLDASGAVQQAFDTALTNTVNVTTSVTGTRTHHNSSATSTINSSSDFTVTGLASGSTQRTVNGKAGGTETTTGTKDSVAFTATRIAGDTTTGLVIPIQNGRPTYPTAGTVIRAMQATVTPAGSAASTSSRREVITYDGSATATVVITQDGVTKNCTKPLPHGKLTCA